MNIVIKFRTDVTKSIETNTNKILPRLNDGGSFILRDIIKKKGFAMIKFPCYEQLVKCDDKDSGSFGYSFSI